MPFNRHRKQYELLSEIKRKRIIRTMKAGWSARRVAREVGHFDLTPLSRRLTAPSLRTIVSPRTTTRRLDEGHLVSRHPIRVLPLTPTHPRLCLEWYHERRDWTATEWNQVVFSDESRFNLNSDNNHVREWRSHVERLNPAFALQRHTALTAGVKVWGDIVYVIRSPLILILGIMTAQPYIHDIL
ncbi:transposable element Tcb2 transposase [Trichonephila clavipes]|nr:transposable element Tcb2 transposase [Trichonephila clavipes]